MSTFAIVAVSVLGIVVLLFLLCFLGVLYLRRQHAKDVDVNLDKITDAFSVMQDVLHFF